VHACLLPLDKKYIRYFVAYHSIRFWVLLLLTQKRYKQKLRLVQKMQLPAYVLDRIVDCWQTVDDSLIVSICFIYIIVFFIVVFFIFQQKFKSMLRSDFKNSHMTSDIRPFLHLFLSYFL
jgi:hypothetical protein